MSKNNKKFSYEEVSLFYEKNGCKLLAPSYVNARTPMEYICSCGTLGATTFDHFKRGTRCIYCKNKKMADKFKLSFEAVKNEFANNGCVLLSQRYENHMTSLKYVCSCGTISHITFNSFRKGHRCRECQKRSLSEQRRFSYDYIRKYFKLNGCKLLSNTYRNNAQKLDYICSCGNRSVNYFFNVCKWAKMCFLCR